MLNNNRNRCSCHTKNKKPREEPSLYAPEQPPLGIIEHLKEEFGDYSDSTTYDWTRCEID